MSCKHCKYDQVLCECPICHEVLSDACMDCHLELAHDTVSQTHNVQICGDDRPFKVNRDDLDGNGWETGYEPIRLGLGGILL